ncbi:MAG: hypothetical protein AAGU74_08235 [Bacillota bacterium]
MSNKKIIRIIVGLLLLGFVIYLAIPYHPPLDDIERPTIGIVIPNQEWQELTGSPKKQMYDILDRVKVQKFTLDIFPQRHYSQDYYVIFISGNRSYDQIELFPYGDSMNGRLPYAYIIRRWGPNFSFRSKQLIVNLDEFIEELKANDFI